MNIAIKTKVSNIVGASNLKEHASSPSAIVARPSCTQEIVDLLHIANQSGLSVIPVGSDSPAKPTENTNTLIIDSSRMHHILEVNETSMTVRTQAGITLGNLEALLQPRDLTLGSFPGYLRDATVGGLIAVNAKDKTSPYYGSVEDAIVNISAVLPTGELIYTKDAPRKSAGPDVSRIFFGSQGTMGIISSVRIRIYKQPIASRLCSFGFSSLRNAIDCARHPLLDGILPSAFQIVQRKELPVQVQLPDTVRWLLCAQICGPPDLASCDRDILAGACQAEHGIEMPATVAYQWHDTLWQQTRVPNLRRCISMRRLLDIKTISTLEAIDTPSQQSSSPSIAVTFCDLREVLVSVSDRSPMPTSPHANKNPLMPVGIFDANSSNPTDQGQTNSPFWQSLQQAIDPNSIIHQK